MSLKYKLDPGHLHSLGGEDIDRWRGVKPQENCFEYLDRLYEMKGIGNIL